MIVGIPTEIKPQENRVGVTPEAAADYVQHGHEVWVQAGAGAGIRADDADYITAGAKIIGSAAEIFAGADMIVKVKEPQPSEWEQLRPGQLLYTYLHLAPDPAQTEGLIRSGCTAIAYETVTGRLGGLPLLAPMSEVAGRLAIEAAANGLRRHHGGRGLLLGGVPGVRAARVVVIGGGVVGENAARMADGLGADTVLLDISIDRLREIDRDYHGRIATRYSSKSALYEEVMNADVVIGAVLIPGAAAPKLVSREMLSEMKNGAVLVDVAIDQGGCFETSKATTHSDPTYLIDEVVHYCVANMPGAVPRTSSYALNNATLRQGLALADSGLDAIRADPHLANGLNVHAGKITNKPVADALGYEYVAPEAALAG